MPMVSAVVAAVAGIIYIMEQFMLLMDKLVLVVVWDMDIRH